MIRKIVFSATFATIGMGPTSTLANECMRLWIERNTIFDNRGYCFGSDLGKGYFSNSDCHTKNPKLSSREQSRVARIKSREKELGCASQKGQWTVSMLRNAATSTKPSLQPAPTRSCRTDVEFIFNLSGRWEIVKSLDVSGPWYASSYTTGSQAFISTNRDNCVGGSYSYRYVAELDDLGSNPINTYTGSFSIGNNTRRCEILINPYSGSSQLLCD